MTASTGFPFVTTVRRPGLADIHLGFVYRHQAEHASWSLAADLVGAQHIEGTTITWSPTPDGAEPEPPVPADALALAALIVHDDELPPGEAFPDLYSRLKAQEGYDTAHRIWAEACALMLPAVA